MASSLAHSVAGVPPRFCIPTDAGQRAATRFHVTLRRSATRAFGLSLLLSACAHDWDSSRAELDSSSPVADDAIPAENTEADETSRVPPESADAGSSSSSSGMDLAPDASPAGDTGAPTSTSVVVASSPKDMPPGDAALSPELRDGGATTANEMPLGDAALSPELTDGGATTRGRCAEIACPANASCVGTGGAHCECNAGFQSDGAGRCIEIDDCRNNPCGSEHVCNDSFNDYSCTCAWTHFQVDAKHCVPRFAGVSAGSNHTCGG
jgi:hypothetical protein